MTTLFMYITFPDGQHIRGKFKSNLNNLLALAEMHMRLGHKVLIKNVADEVVFSH